MSVRRRPLAAPRAGKAVFGRARNSSGVPEQLDLRKPILVM